MMKNKSQIIWNWCALIAIIGLLAASIAHTHQVRELQEKVEWAEIRLASVEFKMDYDATTLQSTIDSVEDVQEQVDDVQFIAYSTADYVAEHAAEYWSDPEEDKSYYGR